MAWFPSLDRSCTTNHGKRKAVRPSRRPGRPRQVRLTIEQLEYRAVPTGGLVNAGAWMSPDPQLGNFYKLLLDPTTGMTYLGSGLGGGIAKVDLTGPLPTLVAAHSTTSGFFAGVIDTSSPNASLHYLYVIQNGAICQYAPGSGSQGPQLLAQLPIPYAGSILTGVIDNTTGYAYFEGQANTGPHTGQYDVLRLRLADFSVQGVEWLATMPHPAVGNSVLDSANQILYFSNRFYGPAQTGLAGYPALEKVDVSSFTDGATVGTNFDLGGAIDAIENVPGRYASTHLTPCTSGSGIIFDQAHDLIYLGTYTYDWSPGQVLNNVWPVNQALVVRIDPTGAGAGFANSVVTTLDLQPGERNLSTAAFDAAAGDIIFATDDTYPMHVYRVHVGDGTQPMTEIGAIALNSGNYAAGNNGQPVNGGNSWPDGTTHLGDPTVEGEVFAQASCFYNGNVYVATDTRAVYQGTWAGQVIKIGLTSNPTASLSGEVYQDLNANGQADAGEPGLAGRTVYIDVHANGTLDAGDMTAVTDASGNYSFANVTPGSYVVRLVTLGGELPSPPAGSSQVVISNGTPVTGDNLGLVPTSIAVPITLSPVAGFPAQGNSNKDYVEGLYRAILNRNGDAGGIAHWAGLLSTGAVTRPGLVQILWNSQEHRADEVNQFYQVFLGRAADPQGLNSWVSQLQAGVREETVASGFLNSSEYLSRGDRTFVDAMYLQVLGRNFDPSGEAYWLNLLGDNASGTPTHAAVLSHAQVVNAFLFSTEGLARVAAGYYSVYLHRSADRAGLTFWTQQLQNGLPFAAIGQAFLAADEFFSEQAAHG